MRAKHTKDVRQSKRKPVGSFLLVLLLIAVIAGGGYVFYRRRLVKPAQANLPPTQIRKVSVVVGLPEKRLFERTVVVQGNLEAKESAMVSPRLPGTIEAVFVDEGDAVVANETKLFQTDGVKLQEAVQIKRHDLTVTQCSRREAGANLEKVRADYHKAELDYNRFKRLHAKQAVTADAFEQQQSHYHQLEAAVKLAEAQVDLAAAKEDQARAALAIAEKDLTDATIYAPISGKVSQRLQEPGEMGSPGHPVVRIDGASLIEVSAYLPAQYYASVHVNQTEMTVDVSGMDLGPQIITYRSPTISPKLRTFEVKSLLKDPPATVVPGALAQIAVILERREGLGVPSEAIQQRAGRAVVFVVENSTAHQLPVGTGLQSNGWTEITESDLTEETPIVTMGQSLVEEGSPVSIRKEAE